MKKLLLKIFLMMLGAMALVMGISRIALLVIPNDTQAMYYVSLVSGLCGLLLFAILLELFVFRRLKKLSLAVNNVASGNYDIELIDKRHDELGALSKDFNRMTNELKSTEYLNREFIRNVSHELKTPLSAIIGYSDLLLCGSTSSGDAKNYATIIKSEATRLNNISKQLLQISKIDASEIIKCSDIYRVDEQIRNILLLTQKDWAVKNLQLNIDMDEINITSNEELTHLIWQNLISNAINFVNDNGSLSISLKHSNDKIVFTISNSGARIQDSDIPYIFNQFYTTNSQSGTGLGLPLVKKITTKLGGDIQCSSAGNLTTFTVQL